jgi:cytochrome P450
MTATLHTESAAPPYPMARRCPLDPPPELAEARQGPAATPITMWEGSRVWLITSHAAARAVLGDRRFTAVTSAEGFPMMTRTSLLVRSQPQSASFIRMDDPDHSRLRSMLTREFLQNRVEELRPVLRELMDEILAPIAQRGGQADLVTEFSQPVTSRAIAALLGVPDEARDFFEERSAILIDRSYTAEQVTAAREELDDYLRGLAHRRLDDPGEDVLSRLVSNEVKGGKLDWDELVPMVRLLLVAGHGTTASQGSLSILSMLTTAAISDGLRDHPDSARQVVDELLRYHSIVQNGLARAAIEDVELDGVLIKAGEGVVISLSAANRDPELFADPDELQPGRDSRRHLAFGHGMHQCLGQWLARVELEEMLFAVQRWLPGARLAIAASELEFQPDVSSYGLAALPVTW